MLNIEGRPATLRRQCEESLRRLNTDFVELLYLHAPDPLTPVNLFGLLHFTPPAFLAIGVLPILVGATQWLSMKLNPQPMDPAQAQIFALMPWFLVFVMAPFAAGLQLYWITNNVLTIAHVETCALQVIGYL